MNVRTRVVVVDRRAPDEGALADAARILRAGGLVAFPTETVYGLGGRALDAASVARIFAAKGRPTHHPLIAHVVDAAEARLLARAWPDAAARLAAAFWPGPLTLVVERADHVPAAVAGGGDSIAVRSPRNAVAQALLVALGEPIAAPSANRYQSLSPTRAAHVLRSLDGLVDLVLDGGPCEDGIESTVVDVRGERPRVLRPGALTLTELRAVVPSVEGADAATPVAEAAARPSPGMDARHYAPRAPLRLARDRREALELAQRLAEGGRHVALIVRGAAPVAGANVEVRSMPEDAAGYGRELFAVLHALDDAGVSAVVVEAVPTTESWSGVADRLRRASTAP